MNQRKVYVVRYGETAWSLSGQHTGRTDLPLAQHGEHEGRLLHESWDTFSWSELPGICSYAKTIDPFRKGSIHHWTVFQPNHL